MWCFFVKLKQTTRTKTNKIQCTYVEGPVKMEYLKNTKLFSAFPVSEGRQQPIRNKEQPMAVALVNQVEQLLLTGKV